MCIVLVNTQHLGSAVSGSVWPGAFQMRLHPPIFRWHTTQVTIDLADDLSDEDEDALELEWQQFKVEYEIAETRLNAQDKVLEQERTRIETKKTMLTTANESLEKRLQKNIEADMKGSN